MKMRFRTDGWHYAELKTYGWIWDGDGEKSYGKMFHGAPDEEEAHAAWEATPRAEPGDVWRIHWHKDGDEVGPVAGYAICCPGCGHVHNWTTANNCNGARRTYTYKEADGTEKQGSVCEHSGVGSCWAWSGSAEENTLTAAPSLQVIAINLGDCAWHGWLQNGDLHN